MDFSSHKKLYSKQATAQIITLCLALLLRQSEEQVGLFGDLKTGKSDDEMQKIGDILLNKANIEDILPNIRDFTLPNNASFIASGDFLSPIEDISDNFASIAPNVQSALVIQILDPAEIELSYKGRVKFIGDDEVVINNVGGVRSEYKKRMNAHINQVKHLCHEHGWSYILHQTDTDIAQTLKDIWLMIDAKGAGR